MLQDPGIPKTESVLNTLKDMGHRVVMYHPDTRTWSCEIDGVEREFRDLCALEAALDNADNAQGVVFRRRVV